ncbi:MAG: ATP-binding cassette domain-containing protein [Nitrospinae bacterium]|nr:ATP-binding cassette domain-containing protein [Nitrospinota bacterium]
MPEEAIKITNLKKDFRINESHPGFLGSVRNLFSRKHKIKHALDGISLEIKKGDFVGYVGENGAGKSTTIKILTGILVPTSGEARVNGLVPHENRIKNAKRIGVVFGQRTQLWWDLPVRESFDLLQAIYEAPEPAFQRNLEYLGEVLGLKDLLSVPVRKLSLGQRMRCDIAASLLHEPEILFLDEPTIGLDLLAKDSIRKFLKKINAEKQTTILLTTHDMEDIDYLCERIVILDEGKIIFDGLRDDLKRYYGRTRVVEVEFREENPPLRFENGVQIVREENRKKWISFDREKHNASEVITYIVNHAPVKDIFLHEPRVADIVKTIYEKVS